VVSTAAGSDGPHGGPLLTFEGVRVRGEDPERARDVTLAVPPGAIVALRCDETRGGSAGLPASLLRAAVGLERPASGRITLFGRALATTARAERAVLRRRVGLVFRGGALFDDETVADNVGFALRRGPRRSSEEIAWAIRESLLLVGLEHIEHLRADELADGVRARVALARAVAHRPELLLLDEPAAGLAPPDADIVHQLIPQLRDRLGLSVLLLTRAVENGVGLDSSIVPEGTIRRIEPDPVLEV
jgi:phospholipid/cholesterol/gamma-HCH transport system ATP-binding protein